MVYIINNRTAQEYGLQKGDIIAKIDKIKITDIYSYMDALSKLKKNKKYKLTYIRNSIIKSIKIKF